MMLSHDLRAFLEIARRGSFGEAAKALHVTQSAVSHRVASLEQRLEVQLFVRGKRRVELTAAGRSLLRYSAAVEAVEREALGLLFGGRKDAGASLHGVLRVGAFSSVSRSVVIPALADFLSSHPGVQLDLRTREIFDLERLLSTHEVDLVITTRPPVQKAVRARRVGSECNVLVARRGAPCADAYLDHDEFDETTEAFLRLQKPGILPNLRRHYVDDIEGVLAAAIAGIGRAVVPRHLLASVPSLVELEGHVAYETPVYLCWHEEPEPPRLIRDAIEVLAQRMGDFLAPTTTLERAARVERPEGSERAEGSERPRLKPPRLPSRGKP